MNPDRHATSHYDYFKDLIKGDDTSVEAHRKFYNEYNAVLDMDADYYLETIQTVFQDYKLVHGTWDVRSPDGKIERVRPQDIKTTALFTVEGELDDISGSGQTEAAHDLCTGIVRKEQHHLEAKGAGHYGIFSGRRWRDDVYPKVRAFILQHEVAPAKAAAPVTNVPAKTVQTATPATPATAATAATPATAATAVTAAQLETAAPAPEVKAKAPTPATVVTTPLVAVKTAPAAAKTTPAVAKAVPAVVKTTPAVAKKAVKKPAVKLAAINPTTSSAAAKKPASTPVVATRWVKPEGGTVTGAATPVTVTGAAAPVQDDVTQAKAAATSAHAPNRRNKSRKT